MGLLALMLMLATPSFAQKKSNLDIKAKKTTAFEQANMRAEFYKQHPAMAKAPKTLKKDNSGLAKTVVGRLRAQQQKAALKAGDGTALMGNLIYDETGENGYGLYSFQSNATPVLDPIVQDDNLNLVAGGVIIDNKLYFANYEILLIWYFMYHYVYDLATGTWEVMAEDEDFSNIAVGANVAYDESTKLAYGLFYDAEATQVQFCSMDYTTWTKQVIGTGVLQHADEYLNFSCDGKGNLFGVTENGDVYKIDVNTLEETLFASTGINAYAYIQGATINPATNTLYWTFILEDGTSGIAQVDLATGKSTIAGYFLDEVEISFLAPVSNEAEAGAPGRAVNLKAYVENDAPNDVNVSFSLPETAYDGETTLTGVLEYAIYVNNELYVKGSGQPGAAIIRNIPGVNTGNTVIAVVVSNAVGEGPTAKTQLWVGVDAPKAPAPATLAIDDQGNATVEWTAVTLNGAHHGYVNTDNVTYTVVRYPEGTVVAEGLKETSLKETLVDTSNLRMVTYGICALNGDVPSEEAVTNAVKVGESYATPVGDDFSDESSFALYTVIDANNDGCTWSLVQGYPSNEYDFDNDADDWLITSPIKMEAGKLYSFKCNVGVYSTSYPERIEVLLGQGDDPTGYAVQLVDPTDILTYSEDLSNNFSVEADGEYRIAFHAISDANEWYLQLFSWSVSAPIDYAAPAQVENAALIPGEKGALNGVVSFNAPTKTVGGDELTGTMNIHVSGEGFGQFINDVTPGQAISVPVEVEKDSVYTYEIVPSNDKGEGLATTVSAFIGVDLPGDIENITAYDNFNGSATFTWDPVTKGTNGGYVDPESVTYRIYAVEDGYLGDVLTETKELSYVLTSDAIDNGPMSLLQLAFAPVVDVDGEEYEGSILAGAIVAGTPDPIPYAEGFPGGSITNYWWVNNPVGASWGLGQDDANGDGGCAAYQVTGLADAYLCSGKISVKGAANPKLLFKWVALPANMTVRVLADRQDGKEPVELKVINCADVTDIQWAQEVIDLSAFVNDPYIMVEFEALADEPGGIFELDDINIYDVYSNDLAVDLTLPRSVNMGDALTAQVIVTNIGETAVPAGDYTVNLYVNDKLVDSAVSEYDIPAYNGGAGFVFTYNTNVFDATPASVKAEVVYAYDLDTENNVDDGVVNIRQPNLARVNDLTAETGGWPAVELRWSAPVIEDVESEIVTEDFEDQEIFVPLSVGGITADIHTGNFGNWKLYDGNGVDTYSFNGAPEYENRYAPMAFQVWNPEVIGYDLTDEATVAAMGPNSGDQFLMSFATTDYAQSDKWLISPLLSGEAQTISFFVSQNTTQYGPELFQVLCSSTDNEISSFEVVGTGQASTTDWTEVTFDLPAGAKYFAIRCISTDVFGFELDDITYAAAAAKKLALATEITGYNIYRNGQLVATVGADATSYIDINETDGEQTYYVTVLYGDQESGLSNGATVVTAISELTSDASLQDADITVYATNGAIVASGKGVYNGLAQGVYVIRNNETGLVKGVSKK